MNLQSIFFVLNGQATWLVDSISHTLTPPSHGDKVIFHVNDIFYLLLPLNLTFMYYFIRVSVSIEIDFYYSKLILCYLSCFLGGIQIGRFNSTITIY